MTGGWITQADRARWQQQAAAELAAILDAAPGASGDRVDRQPRPAGPCPDRSLAPAAGGAGCSGNGSRHWASTRSPRPRAATGMPVYLRARGVRGGVAVSVTATVFDGEEDSR